MSSTSGETREPGKRRRRFEFSSAIRKLNSARADVFKPVETAGRTYLTVTSLRDARATWGIANRTPWPRLKISRRNAEQGRVSESDPNGNVIANTATRYTYVHREWIRDRKLLELEFNISQCALNRRSRKFSISSAAVIVQIRFPAARVAERGERVRCVSFASGKPCCVRSSSKYTYWENGGTESADRRIGGSASSVWNLSITLYDPANAQENCISLQWDLGFNGGRCSRLSGSVRVDPANSGNVWKSIS